MRFQCDAMLGGLARWLRAAGYDALLAEGGWPDREHVDLCARDDRILLTKDRQLGRVAREAVSALLLAGHSINENARELREAFVRCRRRARTQPFCILFE